MPILIEGAADVVLAFGVLLIIGMIMAAQHTLLPMVAALAGLLHWVPFVGDILTTVENALSGALQSAYDANQQLLGDLFTGLVWTVQETVKGFVDLANMTEQALTHLTTVTIPSRLHDAVTHGVDLASTAASQVSSLAHTVAGDVSTLDGKIASTLTAAETFASHAADGALTQAAESVALAAATLTHDLGGRIAAVEAALGARIDAIEGDVAAKIRAAAATVAPVAMSVIPPATAIPGVDVAALVTAAQVAEQGAKDAAAAAIAAAGGITLPAPSLPQVPALPAEIPNIAGLTATVAGLGALVGTLLAETGLDNADCRGKVKGICGADSGAFAGLLAGLAVGGFNLSLAELIIPARALLSDAAGELATLA